MWASAWAVAFTANAFSTVGRLAYAAFFALNIFPFLGLYFDFLKGRRARLANLSKGL